MISQRFFSSFLPSAFALEKEALSGKTLLAFKATHAASSFVVSRRGQRVVVVECDDDEATTTFLVLRVQNLARRVRVRVRLLRAVFQHEVAVDAARTRSSDTRVSGTTRGADERRARGDEDATTDRKFGKRTRRAEKSLEGEKRGDQSAERRVEKIEADGVGEDGDGGEKKERRIRGRNESAESGNERNETGEREGDARV